MELRLTKEPAAKLVVDALAWIAYDKEGSKDAELASAVDTATSGWLTELVESGEFAGKPYELAVLHRPAAAYAREENCIPRWMLLICGAARTARTI